MDSLSDRAVHLPGCEELVLLGPLGMANPRGFTGRCSVTLSVHPRWGQDVLVHGRCAKSDSF